MPIIDSFRASQANRGARRICQNSDCGSAFYDLNRTAISCPICSAVFDPALVVRREAPKPRRGRVFSTAGPRHAVDAAPIEAEDGSADAAVIVLDADSVDDDAAVVAKDAEEEPSGDQILDLEDEDVSPDGGLAPKPAGGRDE